MELFEKEISAFEEYLRSEEKSKATLEKYLRDVRNFCRTLESGEITKEYVMDYKKQLTERFKPAGVNSRLVAVKRFLQFLGKAECCVKLLKIQRQIFVNEDREMTVAEYKSLVRAAGDSMVGYIIQAICGTGIRVSELQYITVEAVHRGKAVKRLCVKADVPPEKVFPHNLRHLFARIFYGLEKDIVRLADLLGHSSINTTRIYTMESGSEHRKSLEQVSRMSFRVFFNSSFLHCYFDKILI